MRYSCSECKHEGSTVCSVCSNYMGVPDRWEQRASGAAKVYIAGKISGDAEYRAKFRKAAAQFELAGTAILNPATLPGNMDPGDYMALCLPMLLLADLVVFLPDWRESRGARIEHALAEYAGKEIYEMEDSAWK